MNQIHQHVPEAHQAQHLFPTSALGEPHAQFYGQSVLHASLGKDEEDKMFEMQRALESDSDDSK